MKINTISKGEKFVVSVIQHGCYVNSLFWGDMDVEEYSTIYSTPMMTKLSPLLSKHTVLKTFMAWVWFPNHSTNF